MPWLLLLNDQLQNYELRFDYTTKRFHDSTSLLFSVLLAIIYTIINKSKQAQQIDDSHDLTYITFERPAVLGFG
jgi:hypothetical protein